MFGKILIVDDSRVARMIARKCISTVEKDALLYEAEDGLDGVGKYKEIRPDVTFMDLTMPVMDGIEAVKEIVQFDPRALIIVATADVQQKTISQVMEAGAFAVLRKPLSPEMVLKVFQDIGAGRG